jgi:hypothetical protein
LSAAVQQQQQEQWVLTADMLWRSRGFRAICGTVNSSCRATVVYQQSMTMYAVHAAVQRKQLSCHTAATHACNRDIFAHIACCTSVLMYSVSTPPCTHAICRPLLTNTPVCTHCCQPLSPSLPAGEKGRRIRELTSAVQKRFNFPPETVELYAEKVANRGLCAVAQAESLRYKLLGGLAVRRWAQGCWFGGMALQLVVMHVQQRLQGRWQCVRGCTIVVQQGRALCPHRWMLACIPECAICSWQ